MAIRNSDSKKIRSGNPARTTGEKKASGNDLKKKIFWCCFSAGVLLLAIIGYFMVVKLPKLLYSENPRFVFRHVEINSTGEWDGKTDQLLQELKLQKGVSNLFALTQEEIRKRLEKLPGIEKAEVRFILPDTLKLKLWERIPRAVYVAGSNKIAVEEDGNFRIISPEALKNRQLPVLKNMNYAELRKPAMDLIMSALHDYPDITVNELHLHIKNEIHAVIVFRKQKPCLVKFPATPETDYTFLLSVLQTAILNHPNWLEFDLRYRGSISGR